MLKIEIYLSGKKRPSWKWRAKASNGKIMASGSGFNSSALAQESVQSLSDYFRGGNFKVVVLTE